MNFACYAPDALRGGRSAALWLDDDPATPLEFASEKMRRYALERRGPFRIAFVWAQCDDGRSAFLGGGSSIGSSRERFWRLSVCRLGDGCSMRLRIRLGLELCDECLAFAHAELPASLTLRKPERMTCVAQVVIPGGDDEIDELLHHPPARRRTRLLPKSHRGAFSHAATTLLGSRDRLMA